MNIRVLSIVLFTLFAAYMVLKGYYGASAAPLSNEMREYFRYAIMTGVVIFIGYVMVTRR